MAFGTYDCWGIPRDYLVNFYIDELSCGPMDEKSLTERLLAHQTYLDSYHDYLKLLLETSFSVEEMEVRIDELASMRDEL